ICTLPSPASTAICVPPVRSKINEPRAKARAETGKETGPTCMQEERRIKICQPAKKAAARAVPPKLAKSMLDGAAFNGNGPVTASPLNEPAIATRENDFPV